MTKFVGEPGVDYVRVHGNSYPVRDSLKQLRGRWNPHEKCWMVPAENFERADYLVNGDGQSTVGGGSGDDSYSEEPEPPERGVTSLADSFSARHRVDVPAFITDESITQFGPGALAASPDGAARLELNECFADVAERYHGPSALVDSYYEDAD